METVLIVEDDRVYARATTNWLVKNGINARYVLSVDNAKDVYKRQGMLVVPGMTLTIEPMLNMGTWKVVMDQSDGWTVYTEDRLPSAQWEYTILITESEPEILAH